MKYLIGIDIGTYESKGVLTDQSGRILAQETAPHDLAIPRQGWAEHDADEVWWSDLRKLTRSVIRQAGVAPEEIIAVGCSAIGPCVLPVDDSGAPLRPAILYGIDTRAKEEVAGLTERLGEAWIVSETGTALSAQSAGPKILWLRRHEPEVWERTKRIMTSTSYLVYRLTGRVVMDHYTATTYGPLYSLRKRGWEPRGLREVCDAALLPELDWSTAVAGRVTEQAAVETGLAPGTPVIVGTADAAAEAVSAGVVAPGDTMLMYGTTLFFIEICKAMPQSARLWPAVFLHPDTYALAAGMATSGALTRWFRDQFAPLERQVEEEGGTNAYQALAEMAKSVPPGAEGLLMLPYFSGERTPLNDPLARGVVAGLTLSHSRAHLYRALLESVAYGIRHNLEAMREAGQVPSRLVAIGGGTRNRLWLQIVSDVTGQVQEVRTTPGASYGDAFLAGVGAGLFPDMSAIERWLGEAETISPNARVKPKYDEYYQLFRALYQASQDVVHGLARLGSA
jgi:xylulokinase